MMYGISQPPFFLFAFGLFVGVTCGLAFEATLKQGVQRWSENRSTPIVTDLQGGKLLFPYLGICVGICIFLASGLGIFGLPGWLSFGTSLLLTIFTGNLIWLQLGQLLIQLERGGSEALDLDAVK